MTAPLRNRKDTAQANRLIKAAKEVGCSDDEDEGEVRERLRRVASAKTDKPTPLKEC